MIKIRNLWKKFGNLQVLRGLSVEIPEGETLVILGRSGVGKSVLLRHIIGLSPPDQGEIEVNGTIISSLQGEALYKATSEMGMLFQGAALFDSMTIEENIAFYLTQHGHQDTGKPYSKSEIKDRVHEALAMVGLSGTEKKMPSELSGGMRKRAALARLIVYRPTVILYDEPTTGLDPITSMQINELILKTQKELKATSIVVTHDVTSALIVGDKLALHKDGQLGFISDPETFMNSDDADINFFKRTITQNPRTFKQELVCENKPKTC